jgi:LemA protein
MSKKVTGIVVAGAVVAALMLTVPTYNRLTKLDLKVQTAEANVQTNLQRRADLLNNAAETVKGYATHEQRTLIETAQARAGVAKQFPIDPATGKPATSEALEKNADLRKKYQENQAAAAVATQQAMMAINQVREAYPELKSAPLFSKLMDEIKNTEERIVKVRILENVTIRNYNQAVRVFPGNILASAFGFSTKSFFEADADSKKAPKIKFN